MAAGAIPTVLLGGAMPCKRILHGLWQTSGGWGAIEASKAVDMMERLVDRGFTTFDLADHYGPAEDLIGLLYERLRAKGKLESTIQAFTKWVPRPGPVTKEMAAAAVDRSLSRMKVTSFDCLQFHWWDYSMRKELMDAMGHLRALVTEGKIKQLAVTNFDTEHVQLFVDAGLPIVSNQVQFSVIDTRPERRMGPYCASKGVYLLAYGTLLGGFLSEKWIGKPAPTKADALTVSQRKYLNTIAAWGDWSLFQEMLRTLKTVAERHSVTIPIIGLKYVLDQPAVAGVIVGLRAGITEHAEENAKTLEVELADADRAAIAAVQAKGRDLMAVIGDCGDEYR